MSRRRKAWLPNDNGRRVNTRTGRTLPGYYVLWYDYVSDGRRLRSKNFVKHAHAREFCKRYNAKQDLGALDRVIPVTITQACEEFIPGLSTRSDETIRQYGITLATFKAMIGDVVVSEITGTDLDRFIAKRMGCSSEATVAKHIRGLKRFFRWCVKHGYAAIDPVTMATTLPRNNIVRRKPRISDDQFRKLIEALDTEDRKLAVQIAATTGLDRGVIAKMATTDIDLDAMQFLLIRFKTGREVNPHIHDALLPAITARLDESAPSRPILSGLAHQGGPTDWWRRAVASAGMPDLRFADLRTYAANWLRVIVGDFDTQKLLGHSRPDVTARHYWQQNPEAQRLISSRALPGSPARHKTAKTPKGGKRGAAR